MIEQENVDILGSFSSNRLDLDSSLSEASTEPSSSTSAIFRDLRGEGQQITSIKLANPIKERLSSFDEYHELAYFRDSNMVVPLIPTYQHQTINNGPSDPSAVIKPLGCSSNLTASTSTTSIMTRTGSGHQIDYARYFDEFNVASPAILHDDDEPEPTNMEYDDFSVSSTEVRSTGSFGENNAADEFGDVLWTMQDTHADGNDDKCSPAKVSPLTSEHHLL